MKWKFPAEIMALISTLIAIGLGLNPFTPPPRPDPEPEPAPVVVQPLAAISLPGIVASVHDGDTMRVRVSFEMPVRIRECWAPELSQKGGIESRDNLRRLCPDGSGVFVRIPFYDDIAHMLTLGRVVGDVFLKDGQSAAKSQVSSGNATLEKPR